jgi:phage tail protein X
MTRETKIGLLVGLAFIIVIGILLSDHMSSTTEPVQASVGGAGNNVRDGVTTPGGDGSTSVVPRSPVTTRTDLQPTPPVRVMVGPGGAGQAPIAIRQSGGSQTDPQPMPEMVGLRDLPPVLPGDIDPSGRPAPRGLNPPARETAPLDPGLRELVLRHPDELAPVGPNGVRRMPGGSAVPGPAAPRTYTAEAGDSVSRITAKMYGTSTKANRELLIKANPILAAEGNPVIAGKNYVIPNAPGAASSPAPVANARLANSSTPSVAAAPKPMIAAGESWYVVQDNDNLWRIAEAQLGNGNLWTQIRDTNKDALKGGETVRANMRLRLPAKPVASASAN